MTDNKESPKNSNLTTPAIDFMSWTSPSINTSSDSSQGIVSSKTYYEKKKKNLFNLDQ